MGLGGLEPPTSRLSGARSSQLSYRPREAGCAKRENPIISIQSVKEPSVRSALQNQIANPFDDCEAIDLVDHGSLRCLVHPALPRQCRAPGLLRKEVIQPQVPLRLPCYDFTPVTNHSLGTSW